MQLEENFSLENSLQDFTIRFLLVGCNLAQQETHSTSKKTILRVVRKHSIGFFEHVLRTLHNNGKLSQFIPRLQLDLSVNKWSNYSTNKWICERERDKQFSESGWWQVQKKSVIIKILLNGFLLFPGKKKFVCLFAYFCLLSLWTTSLAILGCRWKTQNSRLTLLYPVAFWHTISLGVDSIVL